jgi:hypothetical protein
MSATTSPPNGYDLSVVKWMREKSGLIRGYMGDYGLRDEYGEEAKHLRVTKGMVQRLSAADHIRQHFPKDLGLWDEIWTPKR